MCKRSVHPLELMKVSKDDGVQLIERAVCQCSVLPLQPMKLSKDDQGS